MNTGCLDCTNEEIKKQYEGIKELSVNKDTILLLCDIVQKYIWVREFDLSHDIRKSIESLDKKLKGEKI